MKMWRILIFETNPKLNETFEENISPDYLIPIFIPYRRADYCAGKDADCL